MRWFKKKKKQSVTVGDVLWAIDLVVLNCQKRRDQYEKGSKEWVYWEIQRRTFDTAVRDLINEVFRQKQGEE